MEEKPTVKGLRGENAKTRILATEQASSVDVEEQLHASEKEASLREVYISKSFETLDTEDETEHEHEPETNETSRESHRSPFRRLRWSDEVGEELITIHNLENEELEATVRIVILLLHPAREAFEFLHCEFSTEEFLRVSDILAQLPGLATVAPFTRSRCRFVSLMRTSSSPYLELLNILPIQNYSFRDGEILAAVHEGSSPSECLKKAKSLLKSNHSMLKKAVKKARISGRALQTLLSSAQWASVQEGASGNVARAERHPGARKTKHKTKKAKRSDGRICKNEFGEAEKERRFLPKKALREHQKSVIIASLEKFSDNCETQDDCRVETGGKMSLPESPLCRNNALRETPDALTCDPSRENQSLISTSYAVCGTEEENSEPVGETEAELFDEASADSVAHLEEASSELFTKWERFEI